MKKIYLYLLMLSTGLFAKESFAQNVAINEDGSAANANAILDIKSASKGILIPRISTSARLAIPNTRGMLVYDTVTNSFWYNTGSVWQSLTTSSPSPTNSWSITGNTALTDSNFIGTSDSSALRIKVNKVQSGFIDPVTLNTFLGYSAGQFSTSQIFNTAIGAQALSRAAAGSRNTAIGYGALRSDSAPGLGNTAVGVVAMDSNTAGMYNAGLGISALRANKAGNYNTAIGAFAGQHSANGDLNLFMGYSTNPSTPTLSLATAIGANAIVDASAKVRIGSTAVTVIEGQVPFTTPSDGRFKYQVQEDVKGLDFIMQLRPVTYHFDVKRFDQQLREGAGIKADKLTDNIMQAAFDKASAIRRSGFIAQEVEKAALATGYDFSGIIKPQTEQGHYSLSYESFVVPLVKAVQEQQKIIQEQQKQIDELKRLVQRSK